MAAPKNNTSEMERKIKKHASGALKITYLNPMKDRNIEKHASDTSAMQHRTKDLHTLLKKIGKDKKDVVMMKIHQSLVFKYGICVMNAHIACTTLDGATPCYGWMIFEGKHAIKLEGYCVVQTADNKFINVTKMLESNVSQSGLFLRDKSVKTFTSNHNQFPVNKLFWKC
jgi:hypothetical protein